MTILTVLTNLYNELKRVADAITNRETISDELTAIQTAITNRETISDELTGIHNRLGDVVNGLSCLCNAVRDWTWSGDNPPIQYPTPPPTTILPPPPGGQPSEPGWSACAAAYAWIESQADKFDELADLASTPIWSFSGFLGLLGSIAIFVAAGGKVTIASLGNVGMAADLWDKILPLITFGLPSSLRQVATELRTNNALRECMGAAFVMGDGAEQKAALMREAVNQKMENPLYAAAVNSLIDTNTAAMYAYGVEVDGVTVYPQHPNPGLCDCGVLVGKIKPPHFGRWMEGGQEIRDLVTGTAYTIQSTNGPGASFIDIATYLNDGISYMNTVVTIISSQGYSQANNPSFPYTLQKWTQEGGDIVVLSQAHSLVNHLPLQVNNTSHTTIQSATNFSVTFIVSAI